MHTLRDLPSETQLLRKYPDPYRETALKVNAHFHTPYSFSAFESITDIFEQAERENIGVLGINDFITTEGYDEFNTLAFEYKTFPLFNIEFMGLMKEEQTRGIRINDPGNPGRIYLCGKGLAYPVKIDALYRQRLSDVIRFSNQQTQEMTALVNELLSGINAPFRLDYTNIKDKYTKGLVRERHIAMALRIKILEHFTTPKEVMEFLGNLYGGEASKTGASDMASLDNELRSRLLKAGGKAFVAEDERSFLSVNEINSIIHNAGGIPCYPVLLDDANGHITDFEKDTDQLVIELSKRRIFAVELIPARNDFKILKDFVNAMTDRGFIVTMGTEHNTTANAPLEVSCRGGRPLDEDLLNTSYQGACLIAAHQYRISRNEQGYLTSEGFPRIEKQENFITLGNALIRTFNRKN